jgi:hypothetical protein
MSGTSEAAFHSRHYANLSAPVREHHVMFVFGFLSRQHQSPMLDRRALRLFIPKRVQSFQILFRALRFDATIQK